MTALDSRCRVIVPWCGVRECEEAVKVESAKQSKVDASKATNADGTAVKVRLAARARALVRAPR
jgi:hypothetical protein